MDYYANEYRDPQYSEPEAGADTCQLHYEGEGECTCPENQSSTKENQ
tara:strand:+ start:565 stop:705 length:141 start_codon:yes stop_codon:yes gene_type:complete